MDDAENRFARFGFSLTPRGRHTLGSINHLAVFANDYLELIGAEDGDEGRRDLLDWPIGLNGLVFATEHSGATYTALREAGVPVDPPAEFSRPVALADGSYDAVFRTVRLPPGPFPAGRLYFCHHLTRDLVWRDEWRAHANGAIGISSVLIASRDPAREASLFRKMFGPRAVASVASGFRLFVGLSHVDVLAPESLHEGFGGAFPRDQERSAWMAGLVVRTCDPQAAAAALRAAEIDFVRETALGITVPAGTALETMIAFVS